MYINYSLKLFLYELFPELYIKRVKYRLEGSCCKCGDCCRYIMGPGFFAEATFKLIGLLLHKYRRFRILGKDAYGNLIVACKLIREDGLCPDYKNRPGICRDYPEKTPLSGTLYKRCSYKTFPKKKFQDYFKD